MTTFDERAKNLLAEVWNDIQRRSRNAEADRAAATPKKHRLTRVFPRGSGTNYTYWVGSKRRLSKRREDRIWFCVSHQRNAAGSFLLWREVRRYRLKAGQWKLFEGERFDYQWSTSKRELRELAKLKADKDRKAWASECAMKLPDAPQEAKDLLAAAIG